LFLDISDILRYLTNRLDRLPRWEEFMNMWYEKHPEFKVKAKANKACKRA